MTRLLRLACAQLGPVARGESRKQVVDRLCALMREAARTGAQLVAFPELALTTFFPRWTLGEAELDSFYERTMPSPQTESLFALARSLRIGFYLGYAELAQASDGTSHRYNSAVLVDQAGNIVGHYRKIHLPGDREPRVNVPYEHLEKRYFEPGDLGFNTWRAFDGVIGMGLCNDRRWPECWRVLGLRGVEMALFGFNTPMVNPEAPDMDAHVKDHHRLVMRAGAYQNGTWAAAIAKAGVEEGQELLADTIIINPAGEIVAQSQGCGDEVVRWDCDLDETRVYKESIFDFAAHREPAWYRPIVEQKGATPPPVKPGSA